MASGYTLDFFDAQRRAKRNTTLLVVLMLAATGATILCCYPVGVYAYWYVAGDKVSYLDFFWQPQILAGVTAAVLLLVSGGSGYKVLQLRQGGGSYLAEHLGGERVPTTGTQDPALRRAVNVVEEMSIASGVPIPPVYLLDGESGINAFAAGWDTEHAVIGLTRGTVEKLSRDELQGVVAHEFSHILSSDMRINIRLIGIVHGILLIGLIGGGLLRATFYSGDRRRRRSSSSESDGFPWPLIVVGLALLVIGYVGVFFGNLIKAAISRQREYLADAAAVQFTRNPDGIGGALQKIAAYVSGSHLAADHAEEASHLFFAQGVPAWMGGMLATHPPLKTRIRRVLPQWDGTLPKIKTVTPPPPPPRATAGLAGGVSPRFGEAEPPPSGGGYGLGGAGAALAGVGNLDRAHVVYAQQLIAAISEDVRRASQSAEDAPAVLLSLLVDERDDIQSKQLAAVEQTLGTDAAARLRTLAPEVQKIDRPARLVLLDLCLPALRPLPSEQRQRVLKAAEALVHADGRVDLSEWALQRVLRRHLRAMDQVRGPGVRFYSFNSLTHELAVVLSTLAWVGQTDPAAAGRAVRNAGGELKLSGRREVTLLPKEALSLDALDAAVDRLSETGPRQKRSLLRALAGCVSEDGRVTQREGELFRAVAESLGVPFPPLLPGQPLR